MPFDPQDRFLGLSTEQRQEKIAQIDFDNQFSISGKVLALVFDVAESAICRDRKTDVYRDALDDCGRGRCKRIRSKSYELIELCIDAGLRTAQDESDPPDHLKGPAVAAWYNYQSAKIERGSRLCQWYMDKANEISRMTESGVSDDKPATSLLEAIFAPSVVALQRENAELRAELAEGKARLAAIETRLGALNGQGKEILDGI